MVYSICKKSISGLSNLVTTCLNTFWVSFHSEVRSNTLEVLYGIIFSDSVMCATEIAPYLSFCNPLPYVTISLKSNIVTQIRPNFPNIINICYSCIVIHHGPKVLNACIIFEETEKH